MYHCIGVLTDEVTVLKHKSSTVHTLKHSQEELVKDSEQQNLKLDELRTKISINTDDNLVLREKMLSNDHNIKTIDGTLVDLRRNLSSQKQLVESNVEYITVMRRHEMQMEKSIIRTKTENKQQIVRLQSDLIGVREAHEETKAHINQSIMVFKKNVSFLQKNADLYGMTITAIQRHALQMDESIIKMKTENKAQIEDLKKTFAWLQSDHNGVKDVQVETKTQLIQTKMLLRNELLSLQKKVESTEVNIKAIEKDNLQRKRTILEMKTETKEQFEDVKKTFARLQSDHNGAKDVQVETNKQLIQTQLLLRNELLSLQKRVEFTEVNIKTIEKDNLQRERTIMRDLNDIYKELAKELKDTFKQIIEQVTNVYTVTHRINARIEKLEANRSHDTGIVWLIKEGIKTLEEAEQQKLKLDELRNKVSAITDDNLKTRDKILSNHHNIKTIDETCVDLRKKVSSLQNIGESNVEYITVMRRHEMQMEKSIIITKTEHKQQIEDLNETIARLHSDLIGVKNEHVESKAQLNKSIMLQNKIDLYEVTSMAMQRNAQQTDKSIIELKTKHFVQTEDLKKTISRLQSDHNNVKYAHVETKDQLIQTKMLSRNELLSLQRQVEATEVDIKVIEKENLQRERTIVEMKTENMRESKEMYNRLQSNRIVVKGEHEVTKKPLKDTFGIINDEIKTVDRVNDYINDRIYKLEARQKDKDIEHVVWLIKTGISIIANILWNTFFSEDIFSKM
ncbi:putative leucine-rich repeat-containing protein DDB_G0290503 [Mytilus trossulus]|uniref:putative leucine-rich repeat-containing protein DDB_G0290503 n=1 Tax=Mytilus trossulus TaxID=6551 RepID=UPI003005C4C2